jgi:hypothetical protein
VYPITVFMTDDDIKRAIELLRRRGYRVQSRRGAKIRATFVIDKALHTEFRKLQSALGWEVQDAINEALELWLDARRSLVETGKKGSEK